MIIQDRDIVAMFKAATVAGALGVLALCGLTVWLTWWAGS